MKPPPHRILLVLGGPPPSPGLLAAEMEQAGRVIAVDGGLRSFREVFSDRSPDLLIGDLDSCDPAEAKCEVLHIEDQDSTDLEKALAWLRDHEVTRVSVLGGIGGRSDHFLTNLIRLAHLPAAIEVRCLSDAEGFYRLTPEVAYAGPARPGQTVSVLPIESAVVTSLGLRWELAATELSATGRVSQSNQATGDRLEVTCQRGLAWLITQGTPLRRGTSRGPGTGG